MDDHRYTFGPHHCVPNAIRDAWTMSCQGFETRIGHYATETPGVNHVQAQALVKDEWRWLTTHAGDMFPRVWDRHFDYGDEPRFQTLDEFIAEQRQFRHP